MLNVATNQKIKFLRGAGLWSIEFSDECEQLLTCNSIPGLGTGGDDMSGEMTNAFPGGFSLPTCLVGQNRLLRHATREGSSAGLCSDRT